MMLHKRFFGSLLTTTVLLVSSTTSAFMTTGPSAARLRAAFVRSEVSFLRMSVDFASKDEVTKALEDKRTTILDVRRPDEITETGHWEASGCGWVHMPCTPVDADLLEKTAESMLRDKSAPVIIHCASGKRAAKAKEVLDKLGYEQVLNAGGWIQVEELKNED